MPDSIQPTGILTRVQFTHEQGARLEVISQRSAINELGLAREQYDGSQFLSVGDEVTLNGEQYEVLNVYLQFLSFLNSSTVPDIDPATYLTDENEQLPNNLFIHVQVRPKR